MQNIKFQKQIRKNNVDSHVSEPDLYNQNHVEGVIHEVRRKWYRAMIRKHVPAKLWDYGIRWVVNIMSITHSSVGGINECLSLSNVTGERLIYLNILTLVSMIESDIRTMLDLVRHFFVDGLKWRKHKITSCIIIS